MLVSHLSDQFFLSGDIAKATGFIKRARERFLNIDVLAQPHCAEGHGSMHVIGNSAADADEIVSFFFQHLAPVGIKGGVGEFLQ